MSKYIVIPSALEEQETEVIQMPLGVLASSLYEFHDDALAYDADDTAPGWGHADYLYPAEGFDTAFELLMKDPSLSQSRHTGLIQMEIAERTDGDDMDSITLTAHDRTGVVKFAQRWVFEG